MPERHWSGARLVIGHVDAPFLRVGAHGALPTRSRETALALANELHRQAQAHPEDFAQLVAQHSEHEDAARGGDFGSWSSREPTPFARELELLERLHVGAVAPPLELLRIHARTGRFADTASPEDRRQAYREVVARARALLLPSALEGYLTLLQESFEQALLRL